MKKAFLLAAGLGKRLKPLTNEMPKCLLPINNKINEILINTHWYAEKVREFVFSLQESHGILVEDATNFNIKKKKPKAKNCFIP